MAADPSKSNPHAGKTSAPSFQIASVATGDIVFVYDGSRSPIKRVKRWINILGQRILAAMRKTDPSPLKRETQKYSHVMLGLGQGLIIHADGKTVAVEIVSDALRYDTRDASRFQIYRRKGITAEQADHIVKPAMRYYHQRYSFFTYFLEAHAEDTTQFCSRLVAHAYREADMPLTTLPDNQVLPMDLYRICQSDAWEDVTALAIANSIPAEIDALIPPVDVEGVGKMSLSELFEKSDAVLLQAANNQKQFIALQYKVARDVMQNEAILAKYVGAQFDRSKQLTLDPNLLDDKDAFRIARVLEQLSTLLELSLLPKIDLLVTNTYLNTANEGENVGLYAGYPPPLAIREMQLNREMIAIFDYLLLADLGLSILLAHRMPHEQFARFRSVSAKYADRFIEALEPIDDVSGYENSDTLFLWVQREGDRDETRKIFARIIAWLKVIAILRKSGSRTK
ncbi:MAG TPA: hypothetical protein VHZ52_16015 [Acidobacteriaceae bacterium]|jgi:hypothetical protein|nr:hypothetical protein [Acidobacteriaceae bacterium]